MNKVKVIGVGGMGGRFVTQFIASPFNAGFATIVLETSQKDLGNMKCDKSFLMGEKVLSENGARGEPEAGRMAAEGNAENIAAMVKGAEAVFLVAGGGAGTGSGAAPVVARIAKQSGVPKVVALLTRPFMFEGAVRREAAQTSFEKLTQTADLAYAFGNEELYDEGILRSLEVPGDLAEKPGERFVLGNELSDLSSRSWRANERLGQAIRLFMDALDGNGVKAESGVLLNALKDKGCAWLGMGGGAIGARGQYEAIARACHWSLRKGGNLQGVRKVVVHLLQGEERPVKETTEIPDLLNRVLDRKVETSVQVRCEPLLKQKIRLTLAGCACRPGMWRGRGE